VNDYIYFCSKKVFKQFDLGLKHPSLYDHFIVTKDKFSYIYPKDHSPNIINPQNFFKIKQELGFNRLIVIDKIHSKKDVVRVADHINRTGKSFLRGKTPFKDFPTFPDISNMYNKVNGETLMSVGEKNTLNINTKENVILSSWIAAISPVWNYINVKIIGIGIGEEISSIKAIAGFIK